VHPIVREPVAYNVCRMVRANERGERNIVIESINSRLWKPEIVMQATVVVSGDLEFREEMYTFR
jgi:hypothetical protein